jgi:hypothetical protein
MTLFRRNIYTHVDHDGTNTHIDAQGLRLWCLQHKPEVYLIPMRFELAAEFIRDNIIDKKRVAELSQREMLGETLGPIIMAKDGTFASNGGPNVMLVDGHHRYFLSAIHKRPFVEGHMLEVAQWKPFQLHGIPEITQEQLVKAPVTKRNY